MPLPNRRRRNEDADTVNFGNRELASGQGVAKELPRPIIPVAPRIIHPSIPDHPDRKRRRR